MKVKDHTDFNSDFPETFNWGFLDSPTLSKLAIHFAQRIKDELTLSAEERFVTPGLREALRAIACEALL